MFWLAPSCPPGVSLPTLEQQYGCKHDIYSMMAAASLAEKRTPRRLAFYFQVASGSLLLKDVPAHSLVAGSPAQVIKNLSQSECPGVNMVRAA